MIDLAGAWFTAGQLCLGQSLVRGKMRLKMYEPGTCQKYTCTFSKSLPLWKRDPKTIAILINALREMLHSKGLGPFDRGGVVTQCLGNMLFLYEAGPKGAIYPRYCWRLPYHLGYPECVAYCIEMELLTEKVVAEPDERDAVEVLPWPTLLPSPRMTGGLEEYVTELLSVRGTRHNPPLCLKG